FKLLDESQVVLRAPRKDDVYSLDLKNIVPSGVDNINKKRFLIGLENQLNHKVKIIRCDNGTEFKNKTTNEFYAKKGIKREFSVARTPQQNGLAERKNRTLIETARTMLADSLLPIPFWAEAVNPACYEYILLPLHPHRSSIPVKDAVKDAQEKPSKNATKDKNVQDSEDVADKEEQHQMSKAEQALEDELEKMVTQEVVAQAENDATRQAFEEEKKKNASTKKAAQATSTNTLSTVRQMVSTANTTDRRIPIDPSTLPNDDLPTDPNMPGLEDVSDEIPNEGIFSRSYDDEDVGAVADFGNMDNTINVSPIPTLRVHKIHPKDQILGDPKSAVQTRGKIQKASSAHQALVSYIHKTKQDKS
ncbi:putative ribonuclease H-like domain-containing protein, partial [Tanacetum coccineum]